MLLSLSKFCYDFESSVFFYGNNQLDRYIHKEMISGGVVDTNDGLPFKVTDKKLTGHSRIVSGNVLFS